MSYILHIETSTNVCSVALSKETQILATRHESKDKTHANLLTVYIEEVLAEARITAQQLAAVAIGKGPGSYTGLRIGTATAKGICYAADCKLIAVETLDAMTWAVATLPEYEKYRKPSTLLCPAIDARRMEVYTTLYDLNFNKIQNLEAKIIDENSYSAFFDKHEILFFGTGAEKISNVITNRNAIYVLDYEIAATHLVERAFTAFQNNQFEETAYFEPLYLKDFIASIPRKNIYI